MAGLLVTALALVGCAPAAAHSAGHAAGTTRRTAPTRTVTSSVTAYVGSSGTDSPGDPAGSSAASAPSTDASPPEQPGDAASAPSSGAASATTTVTTTVSTIPANTVQIVVIGDSLTSGRNTPGYPWTTPAQEIFDEEGLPAHIVNSSVAGIGYANPGSVGETFSDLARQVVTARSDIVVLFGSDNDTAGTSFATAVESTVDLVQQRAPKADVVIVGPPVTPAQHGEDLSGIITTLRQTATRAGAMFVDASDWFAGRSNLLSSDGEHPSAAGENYLGQKFAALLEPLIRSRLNAG